MNSGEMMSTSLMDRMLWTGFGRTTARYGGSNRAKIKIWIALAT